MRRLVWIGDQPSKFFSRGSRVDDLAGEAKAFLKRLGLPAGDEGRGRVKADHVALGSFPSL